MAEPLCLYGLSRSSMRDWVTSLGEPSYRADQVWGWMYDRLAEDFASMTSLPASLRTRLSDLAVLHTVEAVANRVSDDGMAEKSLYRLRDGRLIEAVLMHYVDPADEREAVDADPSAPDVPAGRHTLCLSTQAGCAMGCTFCATGQMGLERDLDVGECVEQVVLAARRLRGAGERLGNVVYMGMGEPLANWAGTWGSVLTVTDEAGLGLSARRVTISTVGLVPGIDRLAAEAKPVRLAVSLHAPDDDLRRQLVPVNDVYPLGDVLDACRRFQDAGGRRVTFEYVLIRDINDAPEHASRLARQLRGLGGHVNLIPLNPTSGSDMLPSRQRAVRTFARVLAASGVPVSVRLRRGIDIEAGCGQLRSRLEGGPLGRSIRPVPGGTARIEGT